MATTSNSTTTTTTTTTTNMSSDPQIVYARFRYVSPGITPTPSPHLYHLPPLSSFSDVRVLPLQDIRPSLSLGDASPYRLDAHGFTARRYPSALHSPPYDRASWNDRKLLKEVYFPEVQEMVKEVTGGKTVVIESAILRSALHTEVDGLASSEDQKAKDENEEEDDDPTFPKLIGTTPGSGASPAPKVHLDFAPKGARMHIRKYHHKLSEAAREIINAEEKLVQEKGVKEEELGKWYDGPRWAMFSIWRPLKKVIRDPFVLSDCRKFPKEDYVTIDVTFPSRIKGGDGKDKTHQEESFLARGSDGHDWYWINGQEPEEVLVIQLFDSEAEKRGLGVAGGVMHSSVEIQGLDVKDMEARESLETRCLVIW